MGEVHQFPSQKGEVRMTEGTKSYLIGCHQFLLHPIWVLMAWRLEYKSWPGWWEVVCIFLHDIGHIGKQYLSDPKQKAEHWKLGAKIADRLFGGKGFLMIAGHNTHSGYPRSRLYIPDKRSWIVAPMWWLYTNYWIEDFRTEAAWPRKWKKIIAENIRNNYPKSSHELYLENRN